MKTEQVFFYPSLSMRLTGKWIQTLCRFRGYRARDLQEKFSLSSVQSVYDWFHGKTMPSLENMCALARLFECPVEEMLIERGGLFVGSKTAGNSWQDAWMYYRRGQSRVHGYVREELIYRFWIQETCWGRENVMADG